MFEEIARFLDRRDQNKTPATGSSTALDKGELSSKFLAMLDAISSPSAFVERIEPAKALLRMDADNKANNYSVIALQAFFDELNDYHRSLHEENIDMQSFLHELTQQLQDIRQAMQSTEHLQHASSEEGERVDNTISQVAGEIEDSVTVESSLKTLKTAVQKRIKTIRSCMLEFKSKEAERHRQSSALIARLYERIKDMEQRTVLLEARLNEKDRQYLTDSLTAIPNRVAYEDRIQQECERFVRHETPVCLLVCDIDNFKSINDTYGHAAGDKVLRQIAEVLQQNIRSIDFVARFGGEEYVIVMPGANLEKGMKVAEKLRDKIEQAYFMVKNVRLRVTMSGGIAEFKEYDSPASLFERADNALYIAKECGKNRVETE